MAAVTSAVIAAGTAAYQIYNAEKTKSDTKDAINDFKRQDLKNPYEDIALNTLATDQLTDANLSNFATSVDALQRAGVRGVVGGIPKLSESNILLQNQISQDLSKQERERDLLIARGEENIRNTREQRESLALQGLGQQLQTARQDSASGVSNLVSAALAFDSAMGFTTGGGGGGGGGGGSVSTTNPQSQSNPLGEFNEVPAFTVERVPAASTNNNDDLYNSIFGNGNNQLPSFF